MPEFESLEKALEQWFGSSFDKLPEFLQQRVIPIDPRASWDYFTPDDRRERARQWDGEHDPNKKSARDELWRLQCEIDEFELADAPTVLDIVSRKAEIAKRKQQIAEIEAREFGSSNESSADRGVAVERPENEGTEPRVLKADLEGEYLERLAACSESHKQLPTAKEDEVWGKARRISRKRVRQLRKLRPKSARIGGAPRRTAAEEPSQK